ncbi:MAG TPA: PilZ domain-containing protein [Terriglobales bacterium]|nr:PilZ domain-containing protein [Terriglobales bacterium]
MEGPCIRRFPRIVMNKAIELSAGDTAIHVNSAAGNLSIGGLFVETEGPPEGSPVHLRIEASRPVELDGVIRYCKQNGERGVGIEFMLADSSRESLYQLIAELTKDGALPA